MKRSGFLCIILLAIFLFPPEKLWASDFRKDAKEHNNTHDSLAVLDSLISFNRIRNKVLARYYGERAKLIGVKIGTPQALAESWCLLGKSFPLTESDSGYFCYSRALEIADRFGLEKQKAHIYYDIALLYHAAYDFKNAITFLDSSSRFAESTGDFATLADGCIIMGNIRYAVSDLPGSIKWYRRAYEIASGHGLTKQKGTSQGNLAEEETDDKIYFRMMKESIRLLNQSFGCEFEIASFLNNMGLRQKNPDSSLFFFRESLKLAEAGTLPEIEIMTYNNMAYTYLDLGDIRSAEACMTEHAIPVALHEKNQDWLSTLYDSYADILSARGEYKKAVSFMKLAMSAKTEADRIKAGEQVRLLSAVLELKNKEVEIRKAQTEVLTGQGRLRKIVILSVILGLSALLLVFLILWLHQRYRMKLRQQQYDSARRIIGMEENEKEKVARELHDITGQLIMEVSAGFDRADPDRKQVSVDIRSKISDIGNRIREISHRMGRSGMKRFGFRILMETLCENMGILGGVSVSLDYRLQDTLMLEEDQVLHLYRITQELLTNAGKYARGSAVRIVIATDGNRLIYSYADDGPGFNTGEENRNGMGICNIRERAILLGGEAELITAPHKGTTWKVSVPLNSGKK
jgi:signal transduction histidine kinase